jgi:hypothetical protein
MQLASILLNLAGDAGNQVPKYNVTPSEVAVLRILHGDDAVNDIEIIGDEKRSSKAERERLLQVYAQPQPDGSRRSPAIDMLFPGVAARLYENFDEMELEETHFKTADRKAVERRIAAKDPLDHDGNGRKGGSASAPATPTPTPDDASPKAIDDMSVAELKEYASNEGIDLGDASKKADILAAIQKTEEQRKQDAEANEDDGIEDLKDGQGDDNLFN